MTLHLLFNTALFSVVLPIVPTLALLTDNYVPLAGYGMQQVDPTKGFVSLSKAQKICNEQKACEVIVCLDEPQLTCQMTRFRMLTTSSKHFTWIPKTKEMLSESMAVQPETHESTGFTSRSIPSRLTTPSYEQEYIEFFEFYIFWLGQLIWEIIRGFWEVCQAATPLDHIIISVVFGSLLVKGTHFLLSDAPATPPRRRKAAQRPPPRLVPMMPPARRTGDYSNTILMGVISVVAAILIQLGFSGSKAFDSFHELIDFRYFGLDTNIDMKRKITGVLLSIAATFGFVFLKTIAPELFGGSASPVDARLNNFFFCFKTTIKKKEAEQWGLVVGKNNAQKGGFQVINVGVDSPIARYNDTMLKESRGQYAIIYGDVVVAVNKKKLADADGSVLQKCFQESPREITLVVMRISDVFEPPPIMASKHPEWTYTCNLVREKGETLGLKLQNGTREDSNSLVILGVAPDSVVSRLILLGKLDMEAGDKIVEVNGVQGDHQKLMEQLKQSPGDDMEFFLKLKAYREKGEKIKIDSSEGTAFRCINDTGRLELCMRDEANQLDIGDVVLSVNGETDPLKSALQYLTGERRFGFVKRKKTATVSTDIPSMKGIGHSSSSIMTNGLSPKSAGASADVLGSLNDNIRNEMRKVADTFLREQNERLDKINSLLQKDRDSEKPGKIMNAQEKLLLSIRTIADEIRRTRGKGPMPGPSTRGKGPMGGPSPMRMTGVVGGQPPMVVGKGGAALRSPSAPPVSTSPGMMMGKGKKGMVMKGGGGMMVKGMKGGIKGKGPAGAGAVAMKGGTPSAGSVRPPKGTQPAGGPVHSPAVASGGAPMRPPSPGSVAMRPPFGSPGAPMRPPSPGAVPMRPPFGSPGAPIRPPSPGAVPMRPPNSGGVIPHGSRVQPPGGPVQPPIGGVIPPGGPVQPPIGGVIPPGGPVQPPIGRVIPPGGPVQAPIGGVIPPGGPVQPPIGGVIPPGGSIVQPSQGGVIPPGGSIVQPLQGESSPPQEAMSLTAGTMSIGRNFETLSHGDHQGRGAGPDGRTQSGAARHGGRETMQSGDGAPASGTFRAPHSNAHAQQPPDGHSISRSAGKRSPQSGGSSPRTNPFTALSNPYPDAHSTTVLSGHNSPKSVASRNPFPPITNPHPDGHSTALSGHNSPQSAASPAATNPFHVGGVAESLPRRETHQSHQTHQTHQSHQSHPTHQSHQSPRAHQTHQTHQTDQTHQSHQTHQTYTQPHVSRQGAEGSPSMPFHAPAARQSTQSASAYGMDRPSTLNNNRGAAGGESPASIVTSPDAFNASHIRKLPPRISTEKLD